MRFKTLLGLAAIGGAVAYAQKKRGGEMTVAGIKNSLRDLVTNVKGKLDQTRQQASTMGERSSSYADESYGSGGGFGSNYTSNNGIGSTSRPR
jgi:hypothetical protein